MKKIIAILLSIVMLVSISPAVAAEDAPDVPKPTIEEILNEYHRKSFENLAATETDAASYSNRSGGTSKTLEQETVDILTAAGYTAYNVTADNYEALETSLATDLEKMGLSRDGSYIVVISAEHPSSSPSPNSRAGNVPLPDHIGDGNGGSGTPSFRHTYNNVTYTMRNVTITSSHNDDLTIIGDSIDLIEEYGSDDLAQALDVPIRILSSIGILPYTGTLYDLVFSPILNIESVRSERLEYTGKTNWTITYTQVWDSEDSTWRIGAGIEYVTMSYDIIHRYYDSTSNRVVTDTLDDIYGIQYSEYYDDPQYIRDFAAYAYTRDTYFLDEITKVEYEFDREIVDTHYRPFPELYL